MAYVAAGDLLDVAHERALDAGSAAYEAVAADRTVAGASANEILDAADAAFVDAYERIFGPAERIRDDARDRVDAAIAPAVAAYRRSEEAEAALQAALPEGTEWPDVTRACSTAE